MDKSDKALLRKRLRKARRSLNARQQKTAAKQAARNYSRSAWRLKTKSLALYLPFGGELSPEPLLNAALNSGIPCYLPVLHPIYKRRLVFCQYQPNAKLGQNKYGIAEPIFGRSRRINPRFLSVVLTPLVGFDGKANRLGMGGGYYDTTFQFKSLSNGVSRKPMQIGFAHHCQKVETIPMDPWDLPLDGVISDEEIVLAKKDN